MKTYYYTSQTTHYEPYLAHHGIKGMHWGKRNGPPYPLDYSDHTAEQKRKNNKSIIDGKADSNEPKRKTTRNPDAWEMDKDARFIQSLNKEKKDKPTRNHETTGQKDLISKNTKKIIGIAAVTAGVGVGMWIAYKYNAVGRISQYLNKPDQTLQPDAIRLDRIIKDPNIKKIMSDSLSEVDTILPKGTVFKREVGSEDFDLSKTAGKAIYTTFKKSDAAIYRQFLKDWPGTGKRYEVTLEALRDIRIPSDKKALEIFDKVWTENPEYKKELIKTIRGVYGGSIPGMDAIVERMVDENPFSRGMYALVKGGKDSEIFYEELRKQGYNAIRDYWDSPVPGTGMMQDSLMSEHATILIDAVKDVKVKDISKVDSLAIGKATYKTLADLRLIKKQSKIESMRRAASLYGV